MFSHSPNNQARPQQQPEASSEQGNSFSLSNASLDPYAGLNQFAGRGPVDLNVSLTPASNTTAVGPLTIERTLAPTSEIVVLQGGTSMKFSPGDVTPDFGRRPDIDKITVRGQDNLLVLPEATPVTDTGDGSFRTEGQVRAIIPNASIRFPGENSVVRFDGLPVVLKEGSVLYPASYAQAA